MSVFEAKDISVRTGILEETGQGKIMEIEFTGTHDHHWPHANELGDFVGEEVRQIKPAAILFNFAECHYKTDEIVGLILSVYVASLPSLIRHVAIMAIGETDKGLKSLYAAGNIERIFNFAFFEDLESGRAFLRAALAEDAAKRSGR